MDDIFTSDRTSGSQNLKQFGHALLHQTLNKDDLSNYEKTVENYFKDFDRRRNIETASDEEVQMYDRYGNFCLNTTPHRSYVTPGMSKPRFSVEIRYMPGSLLDETDSEIYTF